MVEMGLDNTSTNIGCHNSLSTQIKAKNPSVYISRCPCHFLHNAAQKACEIFSSSVKFDIEEFIIIGSTNPLKGRIIL